MGITLRQASSGAILEGTTDGDLLVWNAASLDWESRAAPSPGTVLPDGTYPGEPLAWDGAAWVASGLIAVQSIGANDPFTGLSIDASAGALTLNGAGSGLTIGASGPQLNALAGTTLALLVDSVPFLQADTTGLAFFGAAPVARPSITGATTQTQVDAIVAAGVALGLWTDDR